MGAAVHFGAAAGIYDHSRCQKRATGTGQLRRRGRATRPGGRPSYIRLVGARYKRRSVALVNSNLSQGFPSAVSGCLKTRISRYDLGKNP
jgi:hypothetical protein